MEWTSLVPLLVASLALMGTIAQALQQDRKAARESRVQEAANIVLGYNHLTDDLWNQMALLREELGRSQARICELEKALAANQEAYRAERAAWEEERRTLTERVAQLQIELRLLQAGATTTTKVGV
jgi:hypothetical protein